MFNANDYYPADIWTICLLAIIAFGSIGNFIINLYAVTRPRLLSDTEVEHQVQIQAKVIKDEYDADARQAAHDKLCEHAKVSFLMSEEPKVEWHSSLETEADEVAFMKRVMEHDSTPLHMHELESSGG